VLAPTPFAHEVIIRIQQCCVVLVGVYLASPVVCRRYWCFLPGSWLGIKGRHGAVALWAGGRCAVTPQEGVLMSGAYACKVLMLHCLVVVCRSTCLYPLPSFSICHHSDGGSDRPAWPIVWDSYPLHLLIKVRSSTFFIHANVSWTDLTTR